MKILTGKYSTSFVRALCLNIKNIIITRSTRKTEIDLLTAPTQGNGLEEFYVRLNKIQDYHARYPNTVTNGFEIELNAMIEDVEELENEEYEDNDRKCSTPDSW